MARKEDGAALGGVGFGGLGDVHELGYALGRPYWSQGFATEGVLAMIEYARALGLKALQAFIFVENPASARVLRKAGFTDLGVVRRDPHARRPASRAALPQTTVGRQRT